MTGSELIDTAEACVILGVHKATVSRWVASGRLTAAASLPGGHVFHRAEVETLRRDIDAAVQPKHATP
jgi:excisionase family DNA binding protein